MIVHNNFAVEDYSLNDYGNDGNEMNTPQIKDYIQVSKNLGEINETNTKTKLGK